MSRALRGLGILLTIALIYCAVPAPASAQVSIGIGASLNFGNVWVNVGPPALPYYSQPPCPQPNYVWMPGYWAWGPGGYYWVPGTWVAAAQPGYYWTPGYWGYNGANYGWNPGYWGPQVGYYGGINYGAGYYGSGFAGGIWVGRSFRYNTAAWNVNRRYVNNVYVNRTVVNSYYNSPNAPRYSFNGRGGAQARPTAAQVSGISKTVLEIQSLLRQPHALSSRVIAQFQLEESLQNAKSACNATLSRLEEEVGKWMGSQTGESACDEVQIRMLLQQIQRQLMDINALLAAAQR